MNILHNKLQGAISKLEKFNKNNYLAISVSSDEYITGYKRKGRLIVVTILRCLVLLNAIRFGLSAIINKVSFINYCFIYSIYCCFITNPYSNG